MADRELKSESELLLRAAEGNDVALGELLEQHRERLENIVRLRLDPRLQSRINPSDVLQETCIEAAKRLREYIQNPQVPFFIWLRYLANQRVAQLHRHHLGRKSRSVAREATVPSLEFETPSNALVNQIVGDLSSASTTLQRSELRQHLLDVLADMDPMDHEILMLRHFEQLTNAECGQALQISPTAANNRYIRALERLRNMLAGELDIQ